MHKYEFTLQMKRVEAQVLADKLGDVYSGMPKVAEKITEQLEKLEGDLLNIKFYIPQEEVETLFFTLGDVYLGMPSVLPRMRRQILMSLLSIYVRNLAGWYGEADNMPELYYENAQQNLEFARRLWEQILEVEKLGIKTRFILTFRASDWPLT